MSANPADAREIADDLRSLASAITKAPSLADLLREAATALDALAADVERMKKETAA